jgi:acetolactate synthase-1/2/3 large subunit
MPVDLSDIESISGRPQSNSQLPEERPLVTAADSIVELLVSLGVDTFFGVPGGPIIAFFKAILTHPRATLIEPRHETHGTFAAMGFHRASRRVPAIVVTSGPGATNVVTGVVAAHHEGVPMLVICGDPAWQSTGQKLLQDTGPAGLGIERMLEGVARKVVRISHARSASSQVLAALTAATNPLHPGPAVILLSIDHATSRAAPPTLISKPLGGRDMPTPLDGSRLRAIAHALQGANRPLVVVGAGCRPHAARIAALIDAIGAPFVTTPQAKGIVSEEHPLSLRTCGMSSSCWARRYMTPGPDVTLALATDLDDVAMAGTPPIAPNGQLIHVDRDASVFARNYPTVLGAAVNVDDFAEGLTEVMRASGPIPRGADLAREIRGTSAYDAPNFEHDDRVPLAPHRFIADLQKAAPPGAVFVTDIGEHMLFALHYLTARGPDDFVIHLGLGSMASGIGSAVGLALGNKNRPVLCICGDGGMQMAGSELLVALKLRLPVLYAVFNDGRYNMVYHGYRDMCGHEAEWSVPQMDFVEWARSLGVRGHRIERPGELSPSLLADLMREGLPVVLDVRHDPSVRIGGAGRVEALARMSMSHRAPTIPPQRSTT